MWRWVTSHAITIVCLIVICATGVYLLRVPIATVSEDIMMRVDPSADRALRYGLRHFDARIPHMYDIERAQVLFDMAAEIDSTYPRVHHEIARIKFLKGEYVQGLLSINKEIQMHGKEIPSSYYVRALIYGYLEQFDKAAADYETLFTIEPANWAAINDYSWVLLKMDLPEGALAALDWGLGQWPGNAWLLHNKATALYELGRLEEAKAAADEAETAVEGVTEEIWLNSYPGNAPESAPAGLASFKQSVIDNQAKIDAALEAKTE